MSKLYLQGWLLLLLAFPPQEIKTITRQEAKVAVSEGIEVCDVIIGVYEPKKPKKKPIIISFDQPYLNHSFAAVIQKKDRQQFGDLKPLINQRVCVTGEVYNYR